MIFQSASVQIQPHISPAIESFLKITPIKGEASNMKTAGSERILIELEYERMGEYQKAIDDYSKALEVNSDLDEAAKAIKDMRKKMLGK